MDLYTSQIKELEEKVSQQEDIKQELDAIIREQIDDDKQQLRNTLDKNSYLIKFQDLEKRIDTLHAKVNALQHTVTHSTLHPSLDSQSRGCAR